MSSTTRSGKIYNNTSTRTLEKELRPTFFEPRPTTNLRRSIREEPTHSPTKQMRSALVSLRDTPLRLENHPIPERSMSVGIDQLPPKYEVNIDFDEASRAWRANKHRVGESWVYKSTETRTGTRTGTRTSSRIRNRNK